MKVLNRRGSGTWAGVIAGIDHAVTNCPGKCVANMSLGGGFSASLNKAVDDAVTAGVMMVVAAGNDGGDACTKSPASAEKAITIGSITSSNDSMSTFSNFGACVDLYEPGSDIKSAWSTSDTSTNTISGTSMASPRKCTPHTQVISHILCCGSSRF